MTSNLRIVFSADLVALEVYFIEMIRKFIFLLLTCFAIQSQEVALGQISYTVSFPNPATHYIQVEMQLEAHKGDSVDIKMPVWIPGSYMVREFSRFVEGFEAKGENQQVLPFRKVRKNVWRVYSKSTSKVKISYSVYAFELSVRTSFVNSEFAFMNGAALFMYVDEFKDQPAIITYQPPVSWNIISSALPMQEHNKWVLKAENYDRLADSPVAIGNFDVIDFDYKGIPHHVTMIGKANYDIEKIKNDFYKLVDECTGIFGENPNKDYTFFVINTDASGGGLEHLNSATLMVYRTAYDSESGYQSLLNLATHEYFHLWNVKRIRPIELGPFDYENEVYSNLIWFFEGITSYYDDYLVYKFGHTSEEDYLTSIVNNIQNLENNPGAKIQSLSAASFDAWIIYYRPTENSKNSSVSYYTKGNIIASLLDLDILNSTNGEKSLDDVMYFLYHEYYKKLNRGITQEDLIVAFEKVAGKDYHDFFKRYIDGTEELPYEQMFSYAGFSLHRKDGMRTQPGYLGASFKQLGNRITVSFVERNAAAWEQGLNVNDEVVSIDEHDPNTIKDYLSTKLPGDTIQIKLIRFGLPQAITIILGEATAKEYELIKVKKPTKAQEKISKKWLGRKGE